jgi:hypothetical protein
MVRTTDLMIEVIRRRSLAEARRLSKQFARAASQDKEAILAALENEQWVADCCGLCQEDEPVRDGS